MKKLLFVLTIVAAMALESLAAVPAVVRWGDVDADTTAVVEMIARLQAVPKAQRMEAAGRMFLDRPSAGGTLEGPEEVLTVRLDSLDCMTFVETVTALVMTANENRRSWHDFLFNLASIRYRNATVNNYPSRLHYVSDWIVDNARRDNLVEVTGLIPGADYEVKSLDFMTENRSLYPALADEANFRRMKDIEGGYRNHRIPRLQKNRIGKDAIAKLLSGDIVAITTNKKNLDVTHMAILVFDEKGQPHLLHASTAGNKVQIESRNLKDYLSRNRNVTGIRVFRLKD